MARQQYTGGCHCGNVAYAVEADLDKVISCNCSVCSKRGSILTFVPVNDFTLLSGKNEQTDYQFNKHVIHHLFCKTCGILSYSTGQTPDGTQMFAINVRCLDDVNINSLTITPVDGKSF